MSHLEPFEAAVGEQLAPIVPLDDLDIGVQELSYSTVIGLLSDKPRDSFPLGTNVLVEDPFIELTWRDLSTRGTETYFPGPNARLESLRFRAGEIAVGGFIAVPTIQSVKCGVLATTGLNNSEIGEVLFLSEDTVKTHLRRFFARYEVHDREAVARKMFASGFFTIARHCEELKLSAGEWDVIDCITLGMTNKEIGEQLDISHLTVKSHLTRIARKNNGMGGREQLALNALLSSQIDYSLRAL